LSQSLSKLVSPPRVCVGLRRSLCDNPDEKEAKKQEAQKKLNELLAKLKTSASVQRSSPDRELNLGKPTKKTLIPRNVSGQPMQTPIDVSNLEPEMVKATKKVVNILKDPVKKEETESDLLQKLKSIASEAKSAKYNDRVEGEQQEPAADAAKGVSTILENLKFEKTEKKSDVVQARKELTLEQVAFLEKRKRMRRNEGRKQLEEHSVIDIFGGEPLGIFTKPLVKQEEEETGRPQLRMWRACAQRELRILSTPSPRNALEEMIVWTEKGKLWHFPIDNEQGLDYSDDPFHQHVFLEHHLDPWCPKQGPVRHFMELVCVGLSKNPYMTAKKKKDTIFWFKDYFERPESMEILESMGAWELEEAVN